MKLTPINSTLLLTDNDKSAVGDLELSEEETILRHRLELRVERVLYRAAVVFPSVHDCQDSSSAHHYLDRGWRNEEKVERTWGEIEVALQELRDHQLYHSIHQSFDHYLKERFGSFVRANASCQQQHLNLNKPNFYRSKTWLLSTN